MTKVFVGNFSFSIDDAQLKEYFAEVGAVVSAKVMKEGEGGRSRGFGFVEFSSKEDAENAIKERDGATWDGRVVKVSEDRSERRGSGSDSQGASSYGGSSSHGSQDRSGGSSRDGGSSYGGGGDRGGARQQATGYFRAQPLELGNKRRKKLDPFLEDDSLAVDYKDAKLLGRFMSERGRILPRRMTGLSAINQRQVTRAIKRAQHIAILPYRRD